MARGRRLSPLPALSGILAVLALGACRQEMYNQPRYKPLGHSDFFADGRNARPPVEGTVARGMLREDTRLYAGKEGNALVGVFPMPVTRALLDRGHQRYDIFCSPCHDRTGSGNGMVVQRGYRPPPSLHVERLRREPVGHFFDVITNGFGAMPDYASQIPTEDRWAIVAYVRALQLSQSAPVSLVPPDKRAELDQPAPPAGPAPENPEFPMFSKSVPERSGPQAPGGRTDRSAPAAAPGAAKEKPGR